MSTESETVEYWENDIEDLVGHSLGWYVNLPATKGGGILCIGPFATIEGAKDEVQKGVENHGSLDAFVLDLHRAAEDRFREKLGLPPLEDEK